MAAAIKIFILLITAIVIIATDSNRFANDYYQKLLRYREEHNRRREDLLIEGCACCKIDCESHGIPGYSCTNNIYYKDCMCPRPQWLQIPGWSRCFDILAEFDERAPKAEEEHMRNF